MEKKFASLTDTENMQDEAVESAESLSAQLAASVCSDHANKIELTAVKEVLVKTRVQRANLWRSVNEMKSKLREASSIFVAHCRQFLRALIIHPRTLLTRLRRK